MDRDHNAVFAFRAADLARLSRGEPSLPGAGHEGLKVLSYRGTLKDQVDSAMD